MNKKHTPKEHLDKIEALIDAVYLLNQASNELNADALRFQLESLKVLSDETFKSLESIRKLFIGKAR